MMNALSTAVEPLNAPPFRPRAAALSRARNLVERLHRRLLDFQQGWNSDRRARPTSILVRRFSL